MAPWTGSTWRDAPGTLNGSRRILDGGHRLYSVKGYGLV
jgi:hypothetical protein